MKELNELFFSVSELFTAKLYFFHIKSNRDKLRRIFIVSRETKRHLVYVSWISHILSSMRRKLIFFRAMKCSLSLTQIKYKWNLNSCHRKWYISHGKGKIQKGRLTRKKTLTRSNTKNWYDSMNIIHHFIESYALGLVWKAK